MRLVLDTNVLVAAMRSKRGASSRLVLAALDQRFSMIASTPLFVEYEAVMTRQDHLDAGNTTAAHIAVVLDDLAAVVLPAERDISWRPQLRDPDDEFVLEAAVNGGADAIVTFEVSTSQKPAAGFGIAVLTPAQACARLLP